MLTYLTAIHLVPEAELRVQYRLRSYESLSAHTGIQQVLLVQQAWFFVVFVCFSKGVFLKEI